MEKSEVLNTSNPGKPLTQDELKELRIEPTPEYPPNHQPGMRVPKGGSSCANCIYLGDDSKSCNSKYFQAYHGSRELPYPADEYCSDWYEPREKL